MQTRLFHSRLIRGAVAASAMLVCASPALAQGTITFNGGAGIGSTFYEEGGMWFQVIVPSGTTYDEMGIVRPGYVNLPQNPSPFMFFYRQYNPADYVAINLTNGSAFGLTSVQLADPISPSTSPVSISFVGHLAAGGSITNTFTTPGNGATAFAAYAFNPSFSSGLTSVDILASRWAMDNLVFTIPEPGASALLVMGLLGLAWRRRAGRASCAKATFPQTRAGANGPVFLTNLQRHERCCGDGHVGERSGSVWNSCCGEQGAGLGGPQERLANVQAPLDLSCSSASGWPEPPVPTDAFSVRWNGLRLPASAAGSNRAASPGVEAPYRVSATMKWNTILLVAGSLLSVALTASGTTRYVNLNNATPASPYTNWITAATNIQDAVDAAVAGDEIIVTNGV